MQLQIELFGELTIKIDDLPIPKLVSQKAYLVLAYLAQEKHPQNREKIATLLWPERPTKQALSNLRTIINSLRKQLKPFIDITRKTLALQENADILVDTHAFTSQLMRAEGAQLATTLSLYKGAFLVGLDLSDTPELAQWQQHVRQHMHYLAVTHYHQLIDDHYQQRQYDDVILYTQQLLKHEPVDAKAHQALMQVWACSGQYQKTQAQFEHYQTLCQANLIDVDAETAVLYQRLQLAQAMPKRPFPTPKMPLIGRKTELNLIKTRFQDPLCRLLTLTGLGGSGKTRLALEAGQTLQADFLHGVYVVSLADVETAVSLPLHLCQFFNLTPKTAQTPLATLSDYLSDKELLIILDHGDDWFRSPAELSQLLMTILADSAHVCFLVTARKPLNLQIEWPIQLSGLSVDDATTLFTHYRRTVKSDLVLDDRHVRYLCQQLDGLPLAIQLVATQPDSLSWELTPTYLDVTQAEDLPARQLTLRVVLDATWQTLSHTEQTLWQKLSIFDGGFTLMAAIAVTQASPIHLTQLLAYGLIQVDDNGRYTLSPLIRLYVQEKLVQTNLAYQQHAHYYMTLLTNNTPILPDVVIEFGNIQIAWQWMLNQKMVEPLLKNMRSWRQLIELYGSVAQGIEVLETAVEQWQKETLSDSLKIAQARILVTLARLHALTTHAKALHYVKEAVILAEPIHDTMTLAEAALQKGRIYWEQGTLAMAQQELVTALQLAQKHHHLSIMADTKYTLAMIDKQQTWYEQAIEQLLAVRVLYWQVGDKVGERTVFMALGDIYRQQDQQTKAKEYYQRANHILPMKMTP